MDTGSEPLCKSTLPPSNLVHLVRDYLDVYDPRRDRHVPAVRIACQGRGSVGVFHHPDVEEWDGDIADITCSKCRGKAERKHARWLALGTPE